MDQQWHAGRHKFKEVKEVTAVPLLLSFLLSFAIWIIIMITDRRTAASGFFLLLSSFTLGLLLASLAIAYPDWFSEHIFFHILLDIELIFLALLLIAYPLVMIPIFLIGGTILMKKEGIRPRNILSIGLAALLVLLDTIYPMLFDVTNRSPATYIYWYLTIISLYFVIQLASFWISDLLNLIHFKKNTGIRYVIVLGAGLSGRKPTPLLRSRIDKGIEVYSNNPGAKLVFSGGQGKDEVISEAEAMADYAKGEGVSAEDMILENRSANTIENIRFSSELIRSDAKDKSGQSNPKCAVVTSSYHLMRALMITKREKLRCTGYGAHTKLYFSLNAFLREYAGYFRDTRYMRLIHLLCLTVIYAIFVISQTGGPSH